MPEDEIVEAVEAVEEKRAEDDAVEEEEALAEAEE